MPQSDHPLLFTDWPAAMLRLAGDDRATFLHNLCTADINAMHSGDIREAFITNVKGHVLAHAMVYCRDESLDLLVLQRDTGELATHFDRYIIREDVQIETDIRQPVLTLGAAGDIAPATALRFPIVQHAWIDPPAANATDESPAGAEGSEAQLAAARVASGWPLAGVDFAEGTLPQELSRDAVAISFTKGCYLGQETVARLDALGRVNKQLVRLRADAHAPLEVDMPVCDGENQVGVLTTVATLGDSAAGLALIRRGSNAPGTRLQTAAGQVVVETIA